MPSSYDSSTSSVEFIGATTPRSARALATDAATTGSTGAVAERTRSVTVAEGYASSLYGQRAVEDLCEKHNIPKAYTARPAGDRRACTPPPEGAVCVYADALEAGMRVPLHGFCSEVLTHIGLAPSQLTPNGWRILAGFVVLCHEAGVPTSLAVFGHFFKLGMYSKLKGWYYFRRKDASCRALFTGLPRSNKGWKHKFFFLTSPEPWLCPVRWGEPPSKASLTDLVLTSQQKISAAKLLGAHDTVIDLQSYLCETNLAAAFSSSLVGECRPPPPSAVRSTSTGADQYAKKAVASACETEKVKTEPGHDTPALSGKKRNREEANSNDGPCHSELSSMHAVHSCSATRLSVPPGFHPIPRHLPTPDTCDGDSTGREAAWMELEHKLAVAKPSDLSSSMLQTVNYASSYALELEKKLAEEAAARAVLEKKLVVQDAEVVALRLQLKKSKACSENTVFAAALQQVLEFENQVCRRAEHALERYQRSRQQWNWKSTHAPRRA